jgi:hypothetical protein
MHDSDYRNIPRLEFVHDAEWKSLNEATPNRAAREQNYQRSDGQRPRPVCVRPAG